MSCCYKMEPLGALALHHRPFVVANESPRLIPFPLAFDYLNGVKQYKKGCNNLKSPIRIENSQRGMSKVNRRDVEFNRMVKERKERGFTGKEFTVEEATTKQFGTDRLEARAFLEYYWETKAKCLEAVAKGRDSEVKKFQSHPLFSPNWINPWTSDLKRCLHKGLQNEKNESDEDKRVKMRSKIPLRNRDSGLKKLVLSPNRIKSDIRRCANKRLEENTNGNEGRNENRKCRIRSKIPIRIR